MEVKPKDLHHCAEHSSIFLDGIAKLTQDHDGRMDCSLYVASDRRMTKNTKDGNRNAINRNVRYDLLKGHGKPLIANDKYVQTNYTHHQQYGNRRNSNRGLLMSAHT